jgi:hypothetical protein
MMLAPAAVAKVGLRTVLVWSPPPPRRCNGDEGGWRVKAEATKRAIVTATRVVSNDNGDGNDDKSNGNGDKGGKQATTRAIAVATIVVS